MFWSRKSREDSIEYSSQTKYPLQADVSQLKLVPVRLEDRGLRETKHGRPYLYFDVRYGHADLGQLGLYKVKDENGDSVVKMAFEVLDPDEDLNYYAKRILEEDELTDRERRFFSQVAQPYKTKRASLHIE